jgi:hypothetical protein
MKALFPAWSNPVMRAALVLGIATLVGVPTGLMALVRTPYVTGQFTARDQPVQFDHRHHVGDAGIDCLLCHTDATRSRFAGIPPASTCMACHAQLWTQSPLLAPVRESYFTGKPLVWQRVHLLPDFVFFDHSAHVNRGVGCVECHGRVDTMPLVYPTAPLTMQWCLDCHRNPTRHLRPLDHITDMRWMPEPSREAVGEMVRAALHVAPSTNCTACHR